MTMMLLERQGYTVLAASTPGEAIHLAGEHAGEVHLPMTDVVMPEMNGRDLAKKTAVSLSIPQTSIHVGICRRCHRPPWSVR
jgi:CheY-like chemotaxis protein